MRHAGAEAAGLGLGCMGMSVFSGPGNGVRVSPPPRRRASEAAWHWAEGDDGRDEARGHQCRHTSAGCAETGSILRKVDRRQRERHPHQVAHPSAWHQGALDERGGRSREGDPLRSLVNAAHERSVGLRPTVCSDHCIVLLALTNVPTLAVERGPRSRRTYWPSVTTRTSANGVPRLARNALRLFASGASGLTLFLMDQMAIWPIPIFCAARRLLPSGSLQSTDWSPFPARRGWA